jgi:hypothetical protein
VYHRHGRRFQTPWYHLTPDRVVVVLLALEGILLLSKQFHWFAFNEHKGWTVLICLATVGEGVVRWRCNMEVDLCKTNRNTFVMEEMAMTKATLNDACKSLLKELVVDLVQSIKR